MLKITSRNPATIVVVTYSKLKNLTPKHISNQCGLLVLNQIKISNNYKILKSAILAPINLKI
jgi:hypothetical protein